MGSHILYESWRMFYANIFREMLTIQNNIIGGARLKWMDFWGFVHWNVETLNHFLWNRGELPLYLQEIQSDYRIQLDWPGWSVSVGQRLFFWSGRWKPRKIRIIVKREPVQRDKLKNINFWEWSLIFRHRLYLHKPWNMGTWLI